MLRELIEKYLKRKKDIQVEQDQEENKFDISISRNKNVFTVQVSDYISICDYVERMKEIDQYNLLDLICNAVVWNSKKQQVNKGVYYVVINDGRLYNVLVSDEEILIDERVNVGNHTFQRHIRLCGEDYSYSSFKHDETGSTYYTMYYSKRGFPIENFTLSKEVAYQEISELLDNVEAINGLSEVVDTNLFRSLVLDDLIPKGSVLKK